MMYLLITRKYIGAQNNAAQKKCHTSLHVSHALFKRKGGSQSPIAGQSALQPYDIVDWAMLHALGLVTGNRFLIPKKSGYLSDDSPTFTLCMEKITMTSDNRVKNFFHC